jgi:hypothetical protein
MTEANTKLERLLAQSANGTFHLLRDFGYWCPRF